MLFYSLNIRTILKLKCFVVKANLLYIILRSLITQDLLRTLHYQNLKRGQVLVLQEHYCLCLRQMVPQCPRRDREVCPGHCDYLSQIFESPCNTPIPQLSKYSMYASVAVQSRFVAWTALDVPSPKSATLG